MRILHVTSLFAPDRVGGAELFVESLARGQVASGNEVAVATISRRQLPAFDHHGITVHSLGHVTPFFILDWAKQPRWKRLLYKLAVQRDGGIVDRLNAVIREFKPDIVNTHSLSEWTPLIWPMIAEEGVPLVHTLHDFTSMCTNGSLFHDGHICDGSGLKCKLITSFHKRQQRGVTAVAGVGTDIVDRHVKAGFFSQVSKQNRRTIWNTIEAPEPERHRAIRKLGDTVIFGYLGRLEPAKGADVLLEAIRFLPNHGWKLIMAGQVPSGESSYAKGSADYPVTFPGYVDSDAFFEEIDCLVVPPVWPEAFGRTVSEAILRGVPVIGSDLAGVSEQLRTSGSGMLFKPGDPVALAERMREVIDNVELLNLRAPGREDVRRLVHPNHVVNEYQDLYAALSAT